MTEKEKMLAGLLYDASDEELLSRRERAHALCSRYNAMLETETEARAEILRELMPNIKKSAFLQGPIFCDYGYNITVGENFYANFNFTALDCAEIKIGDNVFFGPNCSIVTPVHPLAYSERNMRRKPDGTLFDYEYAKPIEIGDNCWIASNVTIIGGVKIGSGCVIGAGSVVTRDVPDNSLAFGNPCRVIRKITDKDKIMRE